MRQFIGVGAGLIALLFAVGFFATGVVAPFGPRGEMSVPSFVLALAFLVLSLATFGQLIGRTARWAAASVLIGCSSLVIAGYIYAQQTMLFTWASFQTFAAIGLITLWHAARMKSCIGVIEDK